MIGISSALARPRSRARSSDRCLVRIPAAMKLLLPAVQAAPNCESRAIFPFIRASAGEQPPLNEIASEIS